MEYEIFSYKSEIAILLALVVTFFKSPLKIFMQKSGQTLLTEFLITPNF